MNEPFDPLEAELTALQPRKFSRELKSRIAEKLQADNAVPRSIVKRTMPQTVAGLAIVAGLATCVVAAAIFWRTKPEIVVQPRPETNPPVIAAAFDPSRPSVWAYHRAISASPDEIDVLLEKHATKTEPNQSADSMSAFSIFIPRMQNSPGDL
jgi:hypothetical protein